MTFKKCVYFVEGPCEKRLIDALNKVEPYLLAPGKVNVHNLIQDLIPRRVVNSIKPGTEVVFVFDTDVEKTGVLMKNVEHIKDYVSQVRVICLAQVLNFEDEIVRSTNLKKAQDLTKSVSVSDFKGDFCKMKSSVCRSALERHHLDVMKLWVMKPPEKFSFVKIESEKIKIKY